MAAGRQVLHHPGMLGRAYILHKVMSFHQQHDTPISVMLADMEKAAEQLPEIGWMGD